MKIAMVKLLSLFVSKRTAKHYLLYEPDELVYWIGLHFDQFSNGRFTYEPEQNFNLHTVISQSHIKSIITCRSGQCCKYVVYATDTALTESEMFEPINLI